MAAIVHVRLRLQQDHRLAVRGAGGDERTPFASLELEPPAAGELVGHAKAHVVARPGVLGPRVPEAHDQPHQPGERQRTNAMVITAATATSAAPVRNALNIVSAAWATMPSATTSIGGGFAGLVGGREMSEAGTGVAVG